MTKGTFLLWTGWGHFYCVATLRRFPCIAAPRPVISSGYPASLFQK
jgi:hypothetical protein